MPAKEYSKELITPVVSRGWKQMLRTDFSLSCATCKVRFQYIGGHRPQANPPEGLFTKWQHFLNPSPMLILAFSSKPSSLAPRSGTGESICQLWRKLFIQPVMTQHVQKQPVTAKCLNYRTIYATPDWTCSPTALLTYTGACLHQQPCLLAELAAVPDSDGEEGLSPSSWTTTSWVIIFMKGISQTQ